MTLATQIFKDHQTRALPQAPSTDPFSTFVTTDITKKYVETWAGMQSDKKDSVSDPKIVVAQSEQQTIVILGNPGPHHYKHLQAAAAELGIDALKDVTSDSEVPSGWVIRGAYCEYNNGRLDINMSSTSFGEIEGELKQLTIAFIQKQIQKAQVNLGLTESSPQNS
jgi:hypothetical protein